MNAYYPKTHLVKALNSLDSSRPYGRLLENPKTGGSRELFLIEGDFQTSSTKIFPEKHPDFGGLKTNQKHEIQTWFFFTYPSTYELNMIQKLVWAFNRTSSNCHKFQWETLRNKLAKKAKKLNFTIFWALYFWKY